MAGGFKASGFRRRRKQGPAAEFYTLRKVNYCCLLKKLTLQRRRHSDRRNRVFRIPDDAATVTFAVRVNDIRLTVRQCISRSAALVVSPFVPIIRCRRRKKMSHKRADNGTADGEFGSSVVLLSDKPESLPYHVTSCMSHGPTPQSGTIFKVAALLWIQCIFASRPSSVRIRRLEFPQFIRCSILLQTSQKTAVFKRESALRKSRACIEQVLNECRLCEICRMPYNIYMGSALNLLTS